MCDMCLNSSSVAYVIPEAEVLEGTLTTRFSKIPSKKGHSTNDQIVKVKKLSAEARMPTRGSAKVAGHNMYTNAETKFPAKGQEVVSTGIAIGLPPDTNTRIVPRSLLAVKH